MSPESITPDFAIQNAYAALKAGDRPAARHWAQQAAAMAPEREEPWLLLSAAASRRASLAYLEKARRINPNSRRASQGLVWAQKRLASASQAQPQPLPAGGTPVSYGCVVLGPDDAKHLFDWANIGTPIRIQQ